MIKALASARAGKKEEEKRSRLARSPNDLASAYKLKMKRSEFH